MVLCWLLQQRDHDEFVVRLKDLVADKQQLLQDLQDNAAQHFDLQVIACLPHSCTVHLQLEHFTAPDAMVRFSMLVATASNSRSMHAYASYRVCIHFPFSIACQKQWHNGNGIDTRSAALCVQEVSLEEASEALGREYLRNNKVINLEDYIS